MPFSRRRRVVRRRKPVRRLRRRRRRFFKRAGRGSFRVKLTRFVSITQDISKTTQFSFEITPSDFTEFATLADAFEAVRFTRAKVTVLPQQNVANNSTSLIPAYCMFPWHKELPTVATFNGFLSIDRAKCFRGTQVGIQHYVPSTLDSIQTKGAAGYEVQSVQTKYKPTIQISGGASTVVLYTGALGMQALSDAPENAQAHYNIKIDMWCTFINQTSFNK